MSEVTALSPRQYERGGPELRAAAKRLLRVPRLGRRFDPPRNVHLLRDGYGRSRRKEDVADRDRELRRWEHSLRTHVDYRHDP